MAKEDYKYPLYASYTAVEKGRYGRVLDEEDYDRMKDRRLERRGASNQSASGKPNTFGKKPAKYDDLLTIKTSLLEIPSVKIKFYYEIHNQDDELLVTATTSLVFIDSITRKLIKAPGYLLEKLL